MPVLQYDTRFQPRILEELHTLTGRDTVRISNGTLSLRLAEFAQYVTTNPDATIIFDITDEADCDTASLKILVAPIPHLLHDWFVGGRLLLWLPNTPAIRAWAFNMEQTGLLAAMSA